MPPEKPKKAKKATAATVARRTDDILRIRLDGAEFWDTREYVRAKEVEEGSAWKLEPGESPMSDSNLWRYVARADKIMEEATSRSRKKLLRQHAAKRRNLHAKALLSADYRTALACLDSEAKLLGLFPGEKHVLSGPRGKPIEAKVTHDVTELLPSAGVIAAFVRSALDRSAVDRGEGTAVHPDGSPQPVDPLRPLG